MTTETIKCDIMEASVEATMRMLATHRDFKIKDNLVFVAGNQHLRELYRRKGEIKFPVLAVLFDSGSKNRQSYHGVTLAREGVVGEYNSEKGVYYKWHLKPVVVNLLVRYVTNDIEDALAFFKSWMLKDRTLNFDLEFPASSFAVGIHVEINDDLQIPPLEFGDSGELITMETTLIIHTYVGAISSVAPVAAPLSDGSPDPEAISRLKGSLVLSMPGADELIIANVKAGESDDG